MPISHIEEARARFARVPFAACLGVTIAELAPDHAVVVLPSRPDHMNAGGVLQGGASASLLTMAGMLAGNMLIRQGWAVEILERTREGLEARRGVGLAAGGLQVEGQKAGAMTAEVEDGAPVGADDHVCPLRFRRA